MSQRDGFGSGFVIGSIVGGVVGGVLGALLTSRSNQNAVTEKAIESGQQMPFNTEESMETARHKLEAKIAQLNSAIDDVRQQLETVNSNSGEPDQT